MSQPQCCAVLVNFRTADLTAACLKSLGSVAPELDIVVVDNDSGDGSLESLRELAEQRPRVVLLESSRNEGFAAGCNRGVEAVLDRWPELGYFLFLNPDTIPEEGFLRNLISIAQADPKVGVVGGRVLNEDGARVLYENGRLRPFTLSSSHTRAPAGESAFETDFVTGALMLIDARLLREGLRFDERYFLYVEDLDLCMEVRRRGRSLKVSRDAVIRHREGSSQVSDRLLFPGMRRRQLYYLTRNKVLFARKWLSLSHRWCFYAVALLAKPLVAIVRYRSIRFLGVYYMALVDGFRRKDGPLQ